MTDSQELVSLELIDAGDHKDRVVQVLSKVKGLSMPPEQIINSTPCTIASDVPKSLAEKLQSFLEKAGAMVMIESEEDLFSPDDLPIYEEEEEEVELEVEVEVDEGGGEEEGELEAEFSEEFLAPSGDDDWLAETFPEASSKDDDLAGDFQVATLPEEEEEIEEEEEAELEFEEKASGKFQKLLAHLPGKKEKKSVEDTGAEETSEKAKKKFALPSLPKFRREKTEEAEEPTEGKEGKVPFLSKFRKSAKEAPEGLGEDVEAKEKMPSGGLLSYLLPLVVGFLIGAVIMGGWGWYSVRSTQREADQRLSNERQDIAQQIQEHSAQLKTTVKTQAQELETLRQQNTELTGQLDTLTAQLGEAKAQTPQRLIPSPASEPGALTPGQESIVSAFQEVKERHTQSLENGYEAQKQAPCSYQVLLDGKGTMTYAQVVKKFTAKYTVYDIMKSNSLITPYLAEFKIPFQLEMRTGESEQACNANSLQTLPAPVHHEFGSYYGYWTIQYEYKNGKWWVKPTVIEKNRDLYENAFKLGSPDFAKFRLDTELFPDFKN